MIDGTHFTRAEVSKVIPALAGALKFVASDPATVARLRSCGDSEERVQEIINEAQKRAMADAGFAPSRFAEVGTIYRDFSADKEVRKAMESLCSLEEALLNAVLAQNSGKASVMPGAPMAQVPPSTFSMDT